MHHRDMDTSRSGDMNLPDLPADLHAASDAELARYVQELNERARALEEQIAPIRAVLDSIRQTNAAIATEVRRRERMASHAERKALQQSFSDTSHPLLETALGTPGLFPAALPLAELDCVLRTGGAVQLGYATKRGTMSFTDGTEVRNASTWGESTALFLDGWQPGTKTLPGVRVVLLESKVERVVPAGDICIVLPPRS